MQRRRDSKWFHSPHLWWWVDVGFAVWLPNWMLASRLWSCIRQLNLTECDGLCYVLLRGVFGEEFVDTSESDGFFSAAVYVWRCLSTSWNTWNSSIGCCCYHFRFRFCWSFSFVLFFVGGLMEFPQFTLQAWIYPILKWPVLALACSVFVGAELMRNHL